MGEVVTQVIFRCQVVKRDAVTILVAASLIALVWLPRAAGAQVPQPPPNGNCEGAAVVVKLDVVEDRAAANMLAEAGMALGLGQRCLVDAGDPENGRVPSESRNELKDADRVFVVGGPAAIPDSWLRSRLGVSSFTRVAGGNRWETQSAVVEAIISLTRGEPVTAYRNQPGSSPDLPPNTGCTNAVLVKLSVVEDRAAANMLAETFNHLSAGGDDRCLVDVGDPQYGVAPTRSAKDDSRSARDHHVIGGTSAIPNSWLRTQFGDFAVARLSGADRWATQAAVASSIVSLASVDAGDAIAAPETTANSVSQQTRLNDVTVTVFYCGPEDGRDGDGSWTTQRLQREVRLLNETVKPFYESQFGDSDFALEFEQGSLLIPDNVADDYWATTTMRDWRSVYVSKPPRNECEAALIETGTDLNTALILAHIRVTECDAYAWLRPDGPAVVATRLMYGDCSPGNDYFTIVAHELGHSVYELGEAWGTGSRCQSTHSELGHDLSRDELTSIMSYTWPKGTCDRQAIGAGAHVSCIDRQQSHLQWLTAGECGQPLPSSAPAAPQRVQLVARDRQLHVTWDPPRTDGRSAIDSYEVRYRQEGTQSEWTVFRRVPADTRAATITGLSNGVRYEVVVHARNDIGFGAGSSVKAQIPGSEVAIVTLSVGRSAEGEPTTSPAGGTCSSRCRWLHVEVENIDALGPGPHNVVCAHRGIRGAATYAAGAFHSKQVSSFPTDACFFGFPGATVYVIVGAERVSGGWQGGVRSNDLTWPDCSVEAGRCGASSATPTASPLLEAQDGAISVRLGSSTDFDIQYRQVGAGAWRTWNATHFTSVAGDGTWTSIRDLTNGVSYEVRIRSRDISRGWAWSSPVRATPAARGIPASPRVTVARGGPGPTTAPRPGSIPCGANSPDCLWLDIRLESFEPGSYRVYCVHDGWNNGEFPFGAFHKFNVTVGDSGSVRSTRDCYINIARTDGRGVAVYVGRASQRDGQFDWASNWLR